MVGVEVTMFLLLTLLTLLGCPEAQPDEDTSEIVESTCPDGTLGEQDIGCTCGADTLEEYYTCQVAACDDDVLIVDDSNCCKSVDCE